MKKTNNISIHKTIIGILLVVITIEFINIFFNDNSEEFKNIKIDKYNFEQLKKVRKVLDKLEKNSYKISGLNSFNQKFNQDIKPIRNCYYIVDRNYYFENKQGGGGYIFGFRLESDRYKKKYGKSYYAYPKFDLPPRIICRGGKTCDNDGNFNSFINVISNPCN